MKKMLAVILVVLTFSAIFCHADEPQNVIILGSVDNFPPFAYNADGKLTGVDIDVVNEMAKRIGINVRIKIFPWARLMDSVQKGSIDGGFAAFETEARKNFCLYTEPLHYEEYYLFVKKGNEFSYSGISDLYGKKVGKDRGVFVNEEFEHAAKKGKFILEEINDMSMLNIKKLNIGRLDAAIGDLGAMLYYAKLSGVEKNIIPLSPINEKTAAYLVLSKNSQLKNKTEMQKKMQSALKEIREDGTWQKIFNSHTEK